MQSDKTLLVIRWADLFLLADGTEGGESDRKWQDLFFPFSLLSENVSGADAGFNKAIAPLHPDATGAV